MIKRTKYSRLHNDSPTSPEDQPPTMSPQKRELDQDSETARVSDGTSCHHGPSLRDFFPCVAKIRLHSPVACLKGQRDAAKDTTTTFYGDNGKLQHGQRLCGQSPPHVPLCTGRNKTKRAITLHRMVSLPRIPSFASCSNNRGGQGSLKNSCAADDGANTAVHYDIKYLGSVEVIQSMRNLDSDTRMQVTREAIGRMCERTMAKTSEKTKASLYQGPSVFLGHVDLQFSGCRIILTVSTDSVTLFSTSSLQKIAHHPMQTISFASGGDTDTVDYVAYVAKDYYDYRACHILECPQGQACEVISSMGQAFETRFRQLLPYSPSVQPTTPRSAVKISKSRSTEETTVERKSQEQNKDRDQCHYYNVTPTKTPSPGEIGELHITKQEKEVALPVRDLIQGEGWFHGRLGRKQAESLLTCSGDFLVRESSSASGQYVLSGMDGATVHHLLLIDPHGQVRTRDQVFISIGHLVHFHMENQMPIISGGSELRLQQPILQQH